MQNNNQNFDDAIVVEIVDEEREEVNRSVEKSISKAAAAALEYHDFQTGEISVVLVSAQRIQSLNAEYRKKDSVTDVLSFPQYESMQEIQEEEYPYFGDVVICIERAQQQAEEFGHSFERELAYLTVHSVLHLLGYNHEEEIDRVEMRAAEKEIMKQLGVFKTEQ